MTKIIFFLIIQYQKFISPLLGSRCRFYPSCSHYAQDAITKKGIFLGTLFSFYRLMKCHPLHPGGVDILGQ